MKPGVLDYTEGDQVILEFFRDAEAKPRNLFVYLKHFPEKIQSRFNKMRSLLHITVEKRPDLLEELLSLETQPKLITLLDQENRTALHLAAAHGHERSLLILIRLYPELINASDVNKHTAVHLAAINNQYAMVKHLVRAGALIYQRDIIGENLVSLSSDSPDLQNALKSDFDSSEVKTVFAQPNFELSDVELKKLIKNFRALKLFQENTFTTRSSHVLPNNPDSMMRVETPRWHDPTQQFAAITTDTLASLDYSSLEQYLIKRGDPYTLVSGKPLLFALFEALSSGKHPVQTWEKQRHQFVLLLHHARLDRADSKGKHLIDFIHDDKTYKLIKMARQALEYEVMSSSQAQQKKIFELARAVEIVLFKAGLNHLPLYLEYDIGDLVDTMKFRKSQHKKVAGTLLEVCCGLRQEQGRCFSAFDTMNVVQGILTMASPTRILKILNKLWPHLHPASQLMTCFILKEILEKDVHNDIHTDDRFTDVLLEFLNHVSTDLAIHSKDLCELLTKMNNLRAKHAANVANANYLILRDWLDCGSLAKHHKSFDELVLKENVEEVAHELRALFMRFSQNLHVSELYEKQVWTNENSKDAIIKCPHIWQYTQTSNHLTGYVRVKILSPNNLLECSHKMTFFIRVAVRLCSMENGLHPHFGPVMAIMNALSSSAIKRVSIALDLLEPQTRAEYNKLTALFSLNGNAKFIRQAQSAKAGAFPLLEFLMRDLDKAFEISSQINNSAGVGRILNTFVTQQSAYLNLTNEIFTDLAQVLEAPWDMSMDEKANSLQQSLIDINELSLEELRTQLGKVSHFMLFPCIVYKKKTQDGVEAIKIVYDIFTLHFKKYKGDNYKADLDDAQELLNYLVTNHNLNRGERTDIRLFQLSEKRSKALAETAQQVHVEDTDHAERSEVQSESTFVSASQSNRAAEFTPPNSPDISRRQQRNSDPILYSYAHVSNLSVQYASSSSGTLVIHEPSSSSSESEVDGDRPIVTPRRYSSSTSPRK